MNEYFVIIKKLIFELIPDYIFLNLQEKLRPSLQNTFMLKTEYRVRRVTGLIQDRTYIVFVRVWT